MAHEFSSDALEALQFVSRSPVRVQFMLALVERGPMNRCDLRAEVEASRTTVSRNVDALVGRGWVEETDAGYRATPAGELLTSALDRFLSTTAAVERLEPFFRWFPVDDFEVEWRWFVDADVFPSTPSDPYAPVDRHVERLATAPRLRCLLPQVGLRPMRAIGRELAEFDHEIVVSPAVGETLRSESKYVEQRATLSERGRIDFYVSDDPIPAYLGLFEDDVQIGVSDDGGVPRAMVETGDERVRRWARDTYERYRADARLLS